MSARVLGKVVDDDDAEDDDDSGSDSDEGPAVVLIKKFAFSNFCTL